MQFSQTKSTDIKPFLRVSLGIENLRACDPPNAESAIYYTRIQAALGHSIYTAIDRPTSSSPPADANAAPMRTVSADRTWLYDRPSVGSTSHGYLIRGDHVAVIQQEKPDWVKIRYIHAGNPPVEAWLQLQDITR